MDKHFWLAAAVCLAIGSGLALFDFHRKVIDAGPGTIPMLYIRSIHAMFFAVAIGAISVALFSLGQFFPSGPIGKILSAVTGGVFVQAVACGFLTITLIRSKATEFGSIKLGLEHFYDAFKVWAILGYKTKAAKIGSHYITGVSTKSLQCPQFSDDIVLMVQAAVNMKANVLQKFNKDVKSLASQAQAIGPEIHNKRLMHLCISYIGYGATKSWFVGYYKLACP